MRRVAMHVAAAVLGAGPALAQGADPQALAGVYRRTFQNQTVQGESYQAENVLEVVRLSPTTAYVRTKLSFANGHECAMWGVAERQGDALVVTRPPEPATPQCRLTLRVRNGQLVLADPEGACRAATCGALGDYDDIGWPVAARRDIRYLDRLRASAEFRAAQQSYGAGR